MPNQRIVWDTPEDAELFGDPTPSVVNWPLGRPMQDRALRALGTDKKSYAKSRYLTESELQIKQRTEDTAFAERLQRDLETLGALVTRFAVTQANSPLPGTPDHAKALLAMQSGAPAPGTYDIALLPNNLHSQEVHVEGLQRVTVDMYNQAMMIVAALAASDGRKIAYRSVDLPRNA